LREVIEAFVTPNLDADVPVALDEALPTLGIYYAPLLAEI